MQSFGSSSAEKQLSANAGEIFITFAFKVVAPLIPIIGIFWLTSFIVNSEVTGTYRGVIPKLGVIVLTLVEDNEELSGELSLRKNRYVISQGKMLGDNKLQISLRKQASGDAIIGINPGSTQMKLPKLSSVPEDLSSFKSAISQPALLTIEAIKDQNDINGQLHSAEGTFKFKATRNAFSSFFGKRWINRCLNYFGIKIKL